MQPIDPKALFSIFEAGDEQVYKENGVEDVLKNPFVLMGTILNGIENYHLMDIMYTRKFGENYKAVQSQVKDKYFNRMYGYLNRIDSTSFDEKHDIGEAFDYNAVTGALTTLLKYFEEIEQYEKCAVIKRYLDHLIEKVYRRVAPLT
jgi:hypothetical protein